MNAETPRVLRWPFVLAGALIALAPIGIALWAFFGGYRAVVGASVDPSQKAYILADGISTAMNSLVSAVICVPLGAALILYGVMRKRPKPQLPETHQAS